MMGYRFKITSKQNNSILGTGRFITSLKMANERQLSFFFFYTHGRYLGKEDFINIEIWEADA